MVEGTIKGAPLWYFHEGSELKNTGMGMINWVLCVYFKTALEMVVGLEDLFGRSRGSFWWKYTGSVLDISRVKQSVWEGLGRKKATDIFCVFI